jgi:hypothetical protein
VIDDTGILPPDVVDPVVLPDQHEEDNGNGDDPNPDDDEKTDNPNPDGDDNSRDPSDPDN